MDKTAPSENYTVPNDMLKLKNADREISSRIGLELEKEPKSLKTSGQISIIALKKMALEMVE